MSRVKGNNLHSFKPGGGRHEHALITAAWAGEGLRRRLRVSGPVLPRQTRPVPIYHITISCYSTLISHKQQLSLQRPDWKSGSRVPKDVAPDLFT